MNAVLEPPVARATGTNDFVLTSGPDFHSHPTYFRARQQAAGENFTLLPMPPRPPEA